jgi:hypothetical protein
VEKTTVAPELIAFVRDFCNESDRAAVILGAAKIDAILGELLRRILLPNPTNHDDLFDGDGPIGTFSAKIHLAYRLGIIDAAFARALHIVRRIRNDFAHDLASSSLDSGPHLDRVKQLVAPFQPYGFSAIVEGLRVDHKEGTHDARVRFSAVLANIIVGLDGALARAELPSYGEPLAYVAEGWKRLHESSKENERPT